MGTNLKHKIKEHVSAAKPYCKPFLIYLAISLVMFWQVTANIFGYVVNGHGDVYQSLFNLWWAPYSVFMLHQSPYFTNLLFSPIGANLATQTLMPLAGIITAPLQLVSPAFAYNALFFSSFALSGIFMFYLAEYLLKNRYAAFIAGLVYAFAPMHIAQSYIHLDWTIIEWIPLLLLFYIKTINERKMKYAFLAAVSLVLATFMGDIEQGIMASLAIALFTILYFVFNRKDILGQLRPYLTYICYFLMFTFVMCIPFLIAMLPYLNGNALSTAQQGSSTLSNMLESNNLLSFFLPSYYNGIFHSLSLSYAPDIYSLTSAGITYQTTVATSHGFEYIMNINERVSYIGYTVLALTAVGLYSDFKKNKLQHLGIWLVLGIIFAWLSLGPYIQIGSDITGIPSLYLIYKYIPILNIIREPGRFDLIFTLCLGIMAAFGFQHLVKDKGGKAAFRYAAIISILILIEYNGMPLSGSFANSLITSTRVPSVYNELGNITKNFSVLILPALANTSSSPVQYPGLETYYVSVLHKPIMGGYTSRENSSQTSSISEIPLAISATALEEGRGLAYASPINENESNVTLFWLANSNVHFVSVIRSAYNGSEQQQLYAYLSGLFGQPVYQDNSTYVFGTSGAISRSMGKSSIAYLIGNWTYGSTILGPSFCNQNLQCNPTNANAWWGFNPRGMEIFSPETEKTRISFSVHTYLQNNTNLEIALNNEVIGNVNLYTTPEEYSLNVTLSKGFNELEFYDPNLIIPTQAQYITYGIENITII